MTDYSLTIAEQVRTLAALLEQSGLKVTTAESCTGGGIAAALTDRPGSSSWFEYGFVTYSNAAKSDLLQVPAAVIADQGAVSQPCVEAMSAGALQRSQADLGVAISGIAGPDGGSEDKPVGSVWIATQRRNCAPLSKYFLFDGDRQSIREQSVSAALSLLIAAVGNSPASGTCI